MSVAPHWTYKGDTGCYFWGELGYSIADKGKEQSPIDIATHECSKLPLLKAGVKLNKLKPAQCSCTIENTIFTTKVNFTDTPHHLSLDGEEYALLQFHFHSLSEHTIDQEHTELELHLVHQSITTPGKLAVIGVLFTVDQSVNGGKPSAFLEQVLGNIPETPGEVQPLDVKVGLRDLDIGSGEVFRYAGSLTTPPCTEGVSWIVVKKKHSMSSDQYEEYLRVFPQESNRPVQFRNERKVNHFCNINSQ